PTSPAQRPAPQAQTETPTAGTPETFDGAPRSGQHPRRRRNGKNPHGGKADNTPRRQAQTATPTAGKPKTWEASQAQRPG
ncbi:hypothetical protein ACFCXR_36845, partial [Streptomyces noursei]